MLAVVTFHCTSSVFPSAFGEFIGCHWCVPVFFIIGGYFLKEEKLAQPFSFLKGKFKRLYLPATFIYAINVLLHNMFVSFGWYPIGLCNQATGQPFTYYGLKETAIGFAKVLCAGGSGELTMGAMWFLYALLYAFVALTVLYWCIGLLCKNLENRFHWMTVFLLILAVISCVLSQNYNFTISRFSTAITAMFLIWWGMIINIKWKWTYDKPWAFMIALIIFIQCIVLRKGDMAMAHNQYQDLAMLITGSTAAIYVWGFIGMKIETTIIGRFLALIGRESLYIMAFHITGFFICNSLLVKFGVFNLDASKGLYTFDISNNWLLLLIYVAFGVITSLTIIYLFRLVKSFICKNKL